MLYVTQELIVDKMDTKYAKFTVLLQKKKGYYCEQFSEEKLSFAYYNNVSRFRTTQSGACK